uniref:F-box/LRR-repeat protein 15-like leucin rich repeat domain-containing protein n=1 Tax=Acanthochromis polyacanthus TaxID=80966 RepID=A0A3Q1FUA6_9TELE
MLVQKIVEGCPCLLYLNLSYTLVTNKTLRELSRSCLSLQYLSLAYCYKFTDKGFLYLTTGKGWRNLIHLDLSGCTQMTVNGFRYIADGCPALKEIVINDMPTLSDSCILVSALLAKCHCLSAISLGNSAPVIFSFFHCMCSLGNNQLTDVSWKALCSSSQGLRRLHAAECPRMTDVGLRSVASLKNLQYLDISFCSRCVSFDVGILYLTEGSSASKLKELNVSHCSHITDTSVMSIAQRYRVSFHIHTLQSKLHLLGMATLEGIRLKKLVLAECVCVTDAGIEQKLCKNVRDLEHVDVSHCAALTDAAVRSFAFYCRGLVTLRMSDCPKMTDMAVQYLTSGSQYLRELDVSGCILLTDRSVRHLERICPPLCSIMMACCIGISRAAALKLQSRVAYWEHSNDDPTCWFGQIVHPVIKPIRTNDTLEITEQHSVMTTTAST